MTTETQNPPPPQSAAPEAPEPQPAAEVTTQPQAPEAIAAPPAPSATDNQKPKAPNGWAVVTLAVSPTGRSFHVLDKKDGVQLDDDQPLDIETMLRAWKRSYERDVRVEAESLSSRISNRDALLVYSAALFRDGKVLHDAAFHTNLTDVFVPAGAFHAARRAEEALRDGIVRPMVNALSAEVKRAMPGVVVRSQRAQEDTAVAAPQADPEMQ